MNIVVVRDGGRAVAFLERSASIVSTPPDQNFLEKPTKPVLGQEREKNSATSPCSVYGTNGVVVGVAIGANEKRRWRDDCQHFGQITGGQVWQVAEIDEIDPDQQQGLHTVHHGRSDRGLVHCCPESLLRLRPQDWRCFDDLANCTESQPQPRGHPPRATTDALQHHPTTVETRHPHGGLGDSCPKSGGQKGHGWENHVLAARRREPGGGHWVPMGSRVDHGSHGLGLWNLLSRPG